MNMSDRPIEPFSAPFDLTLAPPGSKSLTNRALVLGALATGPCTLGNVLFADDTQVMIQCLSQLGFELNVDQANSSIRIVGAGGQIPAPTAELFCGNSGTTIRFLAAMLSLGRGHYVLDGIPRMRQRPIRQLVDLLTNMAVRVSYLEEDGYPPIRIDSHGLAGGIIQFGASQSSQYLSAVLMASPYGRHELRVDLDGPQTSWPYVAMTMRLMDIFGLTPELYRDPETAEPREIIIPQGHYLPTDYVIEPDASAASYFLAAAALHAGSRLRLKNLGRESLQGDVGFAEVLRRMGAVVEMGKDYIQVQGTGMLDGIDVDLNDMPDVAQTLAVVALFAEGPSTLRGLHSLRVKETDRLAALSNELTKLGANVEIADDHVLTITPPKQITPAAIDTYDDHRMAMSFALAGTRAPGVIIRDAGCVSKTYPEFFQDLDRLRIPST